MSRGPGPSRRSPPSPPRNGLIRPENRNGVTHRVQLLWDTVRQIEDCMRSGRTTTHPGARRRLVITAQTQSGQDRVDNDGLWIGVPQLQRIELRIEPGLVQNRTVPWHSSVFHPWLNPRDAGSGSAAAATVRYESPFLAWFRSIPQRVRRCPSITVLRCFGLSLVLLLVSAGSRDGSASGPADPGAGAGTRFPGHPGNPGQGPRRGRGRRRWTWPGCITRRTGSTPTRFTAGRGGRGKRICDSATDRGGSDGGRRRSPGPDDPRLEAKIAKIRNLGFGNSLDVVRGRVLPQGSQSSGGPTPRLD